jgi:hypothetical protein
MRPWDPRHSGGEKSPEDKRARGADTGTPLSTFVFSNLDFKPFIISGMEKMIRGTNC